MAVDGLVLDTQKPESRQARWQRKQRRNGKCRQCGGARAQLKRKDGTFGCRRHKRLCAQCLEKERTVYRPGRA